MADAQSWMNIVLFNDFFSEALEDAWDVDDPAIDKFLSIVERAWSSQIHTSFPDAHFVIERVNDAEYEEIGLRLLSKYVEKNPATDLRSE